MTEESSRLLLRAEIHHGDRRVVAHTLSVSQTTVEIACEGLEHGDKAHVTLGLPSLVEPFDVDVEVVGVRPAAGHGSPARSTCAITKADAHAREVLARLVALTTRPPVTFGDRSGYRCLLVEDNGFIRDLFVYGVDRYGRARGAKMKLELAEDAARAWDKLHRERFDIAIVDHFLPMQTGSELIARMRSEPNLARIFVVAISVGGPEAREQAMAAGADLFLDKPIVLRDLFTTLDNLTGLEERAG